MIFLFVSWCNALFTGLNVNGFHVFVGDEAHRQTQYIQDVKVADRPFSLVGGMWVAIIFKIGWVGPVCMKISKDLINSQKYPLRVEFTDGKHIG